MEGININKLYDFWNRAKISLFIVLFFLIILVLSAMISPTNIIFNDRQHIYPLISISRNFQVIPYIILYIIFTLFTYFSLNEFQQIYNFKKKFRALQYINIIITTCMSISLINTIVGFFNNTAIYIFSDKVFIVLFIISILLLFFKHVIMYMFKKYKVRSIKLFLLFYLIELIIIFSLIFFIYSIYYIGWVYILYVTLIVWITDSSAWLFGSLFGRKKILPNISPNKTYIGSFSAFVASIIFTLIFYILLEKTINSALFEFTLFNSTNILNLFYFLIFGLVLSFICQVGDFTFSFVKRKIKIKDFGKTFQKHGGILDRFDGYYFAFFIGTILCITWIK